jgi:hypothetical protein
MEPQTETVTAEPTPTEVTKIRNVTHVHMGGGFWVFLTVCVLCFTSFWTLVGMGYVSLDAVHGKQPVHVVTTTTPDSNSQKGKN